jgi:MYXO-CTERM domain-containing protein
VGDDAEAAQRRYVANMPQRARRLFASLRGLDPVRVDALAALLLLIEIQVEVWSSSSVQQPVAAALAAVVLAGALAVRRRWPVGAVVAGVCAGIGQDAFGGALAQTPLGVIPAAVAIFYGAGAFASEERGRMALGLGLAGVWIDDVITTAPLSEYLFDGVLLCLVPWAAGRMIRERSARERAYRESAERLDAEREQRAQTAAWGERARIARELHDVIAHSVSVMVIQAGGARTVMEAEPERAISSLQLVERAGREALAEMRGLLGMLGSGDNPRALAPQPSLADIGELVARTRDSGLATTLVIDGEASMLSPALDLCAYRIVQEALTNAIKHAGPARAAVRVQWSECALELEIADDGNGLVAANGHGNGWAGGHGIAGMRERAALHGGSVEACAGISGGFSVRAHLPLVPEIAR